MATKQLNEQLFDTRIMSRNVSDGFITEADVKSHIAGLTDVAAKGEPLRASRPGADDDLDDETEE